MQQELLQYLACPECGENLASEIPEECGGLREGLFVCHGCNAFYPVIDSIPHEPGHIRHQVNRGSLRSGIR